MASGKELARRPDSTVKSNRPPLQTELFENATIMFRNFKGREGMYNREGERNFCVLVDKERAQDMEEMGWNIKYLKPREDGDEPQAYLQVSVGYKVKPPRVMLLTSAGKRDLGEKQVEALDYVDIDWADVIVRPYEWHVNGRSGLKAYLKTIVVQVLEDYLESKYSHIPDIELVEDDLIEITGGVDRLDDEEGMQDIVEAELAD